MKDGTYKLLLKDLQKLERALVATYVGGVRADPAALSRLARRHTEAEVGGRLDDYTLLVARRSAVRLLLRTVFVRVLEDLGALSPPRLRGERGFQAFREVGEALGQRAYLAFVFRDLAADFPALFTPGDDELPLPDEDACRQVWELWHHPNTEGEVYAWTGDGFDSRFLGDLYQDLDADIRKRFALLQTPHFVESYILDHTLTPALAVWDPDELAAKGEAFALLDPTCGSGHFLLGAFHRLADLWVARGHEPQEACRRALAGVWGCDINPHAVDIARFRLLLEVMARCGERDLDRLSEFRPNLAVLDSLIPWERGRHAAGQGALFPAADRLTTYASAEQRAANAAFLNRPFHVVVGNPPYITPKDVQKREDYRAFWPDSAAGAYALSAPFAERLIRLGCPGAFTGQITANSFMKREFGKKLVTTVLARLDLTGVVDTSGAYIPGHGTPTVILFARNRAPVGETVWAILSKRGEPKRPESAESGLVWSAIAGAGDKADDQSPFVSVAWIPRATLGDHPWSLGGGLAPEVSERLAVGAADRLIDRGADVGTGAVTREDDVFEEADGLLRRAGIPREQRLAFVRGDGVRDYELVGGRWALWPYDPEAHDALAPSEATALARWLWRWRRQLEIRVAFGKTQLGRGLRWYEYSMYFAGRFRGRPTTITFAFVATHNHFVLDRGGKVFNRTAPVIKLPAGATVEDHLDLLGLLNSSTLGFWMKQVFHCKGTQGVGEGFKAEDWEKFYEYDSTKLQLAPLTARDRPARIVLAAALDAAATARAACLPAAILAAADWTPDDLVERLAAARAEYLAWTWRMVALQEELDWLTYGSYGLLDPPLETVGPDAVEPLRPGHRPFEIVAARSDEEAEPDERSAWWTRHGHERVTDVPAGYTEATARRVVERIAAIEADPRLALLEGFAFKRRWQIPDLGGPGWPAPGRGVRNDTQAAAESWLLDRLEDLFAPRGPESRHAASGALARPRPYRLEEILAAWGRDPRVAAVAAVWAGGRHVDLAAVAEPLLHGASMPDHPQRIYSEEGLRKRAEWERVWALQDQEDRGESLHDPTTGAALDAIPVPPKYARGDFRRAEHYALRGKLDVPRERFFCFVELSPPRWGWAGWRDADRAVAQVEAAALVAEDPADPLPVPTADDPRRCGATLGLWTALPDVARWRPEAAGELRAFAQEQCRQSTCPCPVLPHWQAWSRGERRLEVLAAASTGASVAERATLAEALVLFGSDGASAADLAARWGGDPDRLSLVLDDLVASGDATVLEVGRVRRYRGRA